jgi:protein-S-isoprenylcysteine O-methyltransferase Ste14
MSSKADWMVVAGFLLAACGLTLRIVMMMRSSDAFPANTEPKSGRNLLRSYHAIFPKSYLPMAMWTALSIGLVLLLSGFLLEIR